VEIALVDLPHLSNFSDFDAFRVEPDVRLRIVRGPSDLGQPDAVLVGGSKNTLGDLAYLRSSGLAEPIVRLARSGRCEVVGICGGFQMLGTEIRDPLGIESAAAPSASAATTPFASAATPPFASSVSTPLAPAATPGGDDSRGLGLLPLRTVLVAEKTLRRTTACHAASGLEVTGYEIHHGQTDVGPCAPAFRLPGGRIVGAASPDGRVWGTYLHGVFDADPFRRWFIDRLRVRRGLTPVGRVVGLYDIEPALDRLAEAVRRALPVEQIYRMMGLR